EELVRRGRRAERAGAPECEFPHDRLQLEAVVRQLVDPGGGRWRQRLLRGDAGGLEVAEPGCEDVRSDSGQALGEVGVALRPPQQLADDEQGPAVADDVEGVSHGAVLVVVLRHVLDHSGCACCCEGWTCKEQVISVRLQASPTRAKGLKPHGGYRTTE